MKNGTYNCVICFSLWGVGPTIAIWCETPWGRGQNTILYFSFNIWILSSSTHNPTLYFGHLNFVIVCFLWNTHDTVLFAILRPVFTILHFEPAGGKGWSSMWGGLTSKHPSTSCNPVDYRCTRSRSSIVSLLFVCICLFFFTVTVTFSSKAFSKIACTQNTTARDLCSELCTHTRV